MINGLMMNGVTLEGYGGDTQWQPISAKYVCHVNYMKNNYIHKFKLKLFFVLVKARLLRCFILKDIREYLGHIMK